MPGIVGLITKRPRAWAEQQLACMIKPLLHEAFYVNGTWIDESLGVYVGWVASRILSPKECPFGMSRTISRSFSRAKIIRNLVQFADSRSKGINVMKAELPIWFIFMKRTPTFSRI